MIRDHGRTTGFLTNRQLGGFVSCIGCLVGYDNRFMIRRGGRRSRMGFRGTKVELQMKLKAASTEPPDEVD